MPKKKTNRKANKTSTWMNLYKWTVGAVVVMTIVAVGAMVWQYYDIQSKMWMFDDFEEPELISDNSNVNLIEFERGNRMPLCGTTDDTKGACKNLQLSTPTSGLSCQATNQAAAAAAGVTEAGCRMMAATLRSWAGAFRSEACQPGLMFDQKTITSDMLVDKVNKTMKPKSISIEGMHKCVPGLAGRYCRTKEGKWEPCYTVPLKGACKYGTESPFNIEASGKLYKYCVPTNQNAPDDGNPCYTGSPTKPTVKVCCSEGMVISGGTCAIPQ